MKKNFVFMAAALLLLGSCSDDVMNISMDDVLAVKDVPVTFGTYTGKNAVTRAGDVTPMTTTQMQTTGFGVFAYNTETADYTVGGATGQTPNFMYNEKVSTANWTYSPIKYWPNLNGKADTQDPYSTEANPGAKLSFFAYAPYVSASDITADPNKNITQLVAADATVDPFVKYMFPDNGRSVDLLWGTAATTPTTGENILGNAQAGTVLTGGVGKVNVNLTKQKESGKVSFFFKHALSNVGGSSTITKNVANPNSDASGNIDVKQGGFQAILDINDGSDKKESKTVVTIKNIKIKGKNVAPNGTTGEDENGDPITSDGTYVVVGGKLNLATGIWTKIMKPSTTPTDGVIDHNVTSPASTTAEQNAKSATLSNVLAEPASITASNQWPSLPLGVLTVAQNVYEDETSPFVFMPGAVPHLDVTVEYIVRTKDEKLTAGWTVTEQAVTKSIDFANAIEMNKKYNLIMHIGLTDVKFTASVEDWASYNPDPSSVPSSDPTYDPNNNPADPANSVDIDVYVPKNVN